MTGPSLPAEYSLVDLTDPKWAARLAREAVATTATPMPTAISFGDGAEEAFIRAVMALPVGYTVGLLPEGEPIPTDNGLGPFDFSLVEGTDFDGVRCRRMDPETQDATGPEITVPWEQVAHVRVY